MSELFSIGALLQVVILGADIPRRSAVPTQQVVGRCQISVQTCHSFSSVSCLSNLNPITSLFRQNSCLANSIGDYNRPTVLTERVLSASAAKLEEVRSTREVFLSVNNVVNSNLQVIAFVLLEQA